MRMRMKETISWILIVAIIVLSNGFSNLKLEIFASDFDIEKKEIRIDDGYGLFGGNGGSDTSGNNRFISSQFEFASLNNTGKEGHSYFYYTDDFFKEVSTNYNNHLSTTSIELALSGIGSYMENKKDKYSNLKDFMSKMGFKNITPNDDYLDAPDDNTMGAVCANKPIYIKDNTGNVTKYNLIVTAMRSANYESEWTSNFKIGESGDHQGFSESRDIVYSHLNTFYNEHKDDFGGSLPIKLWIVGYSRGAAVANMLGGKVTDNASIFNTTKENIYCYTLGTPRGALIANHTSPSLNSYTNIHNIVSSGDAFQMLVPSTLGFGRYGVDHNVPCYVSDKVHDETEREELIASNIDYMNRYNQMLERYKIIDPPCELDVNDFRVYELILVNQSLEFLKFRDLTLDPFTASSSESSYYQTKEFMNAFVEDFVGQEMMNSNYPGINYASITGRDRYYQKYQELLLWIAKKFLGGGDYSTMISKIAENAQNHIGEMFPILFILFALIYTDSPQDRTHFVMNNPSEYNNVYDILEPIYEILLDGAVSTEDHDFLMNRHRDVTDFLLDLLITDYTSHYLTRQTALGSLYQNANKWAALHKEDWYLSWLQYEDDYYQTEPAETVNIDGNKSVVFTNLNDKVIKIYNNDNNFIGEYSIDSVGEVTFTSGLDSEFVDIVKSYNPVGLELRMPSGLNYKAEVIATNSSLGNVVYKEYFTADSSFYRKEKDLGSIYLNSGESYMIEFNKSFLQSVYSCYPYDDASEYQRKTMRIATISGTTYVYGSDYYSYASEPNIYKKQRLLTAIESIATISEMPTSVATESETYANSIVNDDIDRASDYNINEFDLEIDVATDSETDLEKDIATDANIDLENDQELYDTEEIATHSDLDDDTIIEGLAGTDETYGTGDTHVVNFHHNAAITTIYYYDGANYVKTKSGSSFASGTKIKIVAPFTSGENVFCGWTLKNDNGTILNKKGVDTPIIEEESNANESIYVIELKDYDLDITANYITKERTLTLEVDSHKGKLIPDGTALTYNTLEDFENTKSDIRIITYGGYSNAYWYDGANTYQNLSDYYWDYSNNVTLRAVFVSSPRGGGGSSSGGGGGGGAVIDSSFAPIRTIVIQNVKTTTSVKTSDSVSWRYDPISDAWQLNVFDVGGQGSVAQNGFYEIVSGSTRDTYYFNEIGDMVTGWIKTSDSKRYFFENAKNINEGKMVTGWKSIGGYWYYFATDGSMLSGTITPDGYIVDIDGRWIMDLYTNN
ncbi:MAG: hypothetical protein IJ593_01620 [Lachnospiraceae bacterium]|nr:hypothetical protein [Lachnospiraceae bacterium]